MIALMVTCVMLQMRSFPGVVIVLLTAPLGVIGSVVALLVFKQPFASDGIMLSSRLSLTC